MDKLNNYRQYVKNIITKYSQFKPSYGDVELQIIFDEIRDHYHLMTVGWNDERRCTEKRYCVSLSFPL
jgi:hypothetical protein